MQFASLEVFGMHRLVIDAWRRDFGEELLPIQQKAVRAGVLQGRRVLAVAPASSGKTLIAEMAIASAAMSRSKSLYLVPTRALAAEKLGQLSARFAPAGLRTIISTRDHPFSDPVALRGDFDVLVAVPEKLRALSVRNPSILSGFSVVVVDELQLLADTERGPALEMLLAEMQWARPDAQFVALAAPFGQADRVAEWLGAQLVEDWARPVVLRVGVLHNGVFTYRSQGCSDYGHEELPASGQTWAEMAASLAARLAENEQPTIVFVRDKASALAMARRIASSGRLRPASGLLEALRAMNGGTGTQTLRELAAAGVVVHHGDLRAEEREAIEKSFRDGDLMAVVATSTLAVGVNMPARNVIIDAVRWKSPDEPSAKPLQEPLPHADFLAMAGRAGRLGTGDQFGRAILIAETPLERDVLMKTYVDAEPPLMRPALAELCPDDAVVVLGSSFIAREQGLHAAWARSLTAHLAAHSELPARHAAAATRLQLSGFLDDSWRPTALLRPAAGGMVDAATLRWLASLRDAEYEHWNWLAVLLLCCASPEAARLPFPLHHTELREHDYVVQVTDWALERSLFCSGLSRALTRELLPVHQAQRAAKMCLAMLAWLGREPVEDVELKFHVPAGRLETIASLLSWLMQLAADIAEALGWPKAALDPLRDTAAQLRAREIEARARESYLPPQSSAGLQPGCPPLPAAAANAGGSESEAVSSASEQLSGEPVPAPGPARPAPPERAQPPMLILDTAQPDTVTFRGASFRVTPCEFRLLWKLAEAAGACVAADRLGNYVFGPQDYIAPYQLYSHISRLRKKMEAASGREADGRKLIESVPRRGWRLNIPSAQIRLVGDEAA